MSELLCIFNTESLATSVCFGFWIIAILLFVGLVIEFTVKFICSIIRHTLTKRENEKVFKKYNYHPKF